MMRFLQLCRTWPVAGRLSVWWPRGDGAERHRPSTQGLTQLLQQLPSADFSEKQGLIKQLAQYHAPAGAHDSAGPARRQSLYARTSDGRVFLTEADGDNLKLIDPLTGAAAGSVSADGFTRIGVNNQLRKTLHIALAQFDLASPDAHVRLAAVREMLRAVDAEIVAVLRAHLPQESRRGGKARFWMAWRWPIWTAAISPTCAWPRSRRWEAASTAMSTTA